jgi:Xaa-Pro dipeptidase
MFELAAVQGAIAEMGLDGWLLYDFRGANPLARRILHLPETQMLSRRWFYMIPAQGQPRKLVHRIEPHSLDHLPGSMQIYLSRQQLEAGLAWVLGGPGRVAMEYAPHITNPYISRVDAGTIEAVRAMGVEVVSSGDLVQRFEAVWDEEQWAMHREAARHTETAFQVAFAFIVQQVRQSGSVLESAVQARILDHFREHGLVTYSPPIVAANAHSSDPHFETCPANDVPIREGDFVLIDLWAKLNRPRAVYSDLTWTAFVGREVPLRMAQVFAVVAAARDAAIQRVRNAFARGERLRGCDVDDASRQIIEQAGYGEFFYHRTGHSIGQEVHGNGANMDNLETRDERTVLPCTCFSIEPGIYLPEFGIRSETNVYIDAQHHVHTTGGDLQTAIVPLLARYPG